MSATEPTRIEPERPNGAVVRSGPVVKSHPPAELPPRRNWPIAILGIPFDVVTMDETVARIDEMIRSGKPHYLATANVDFVVQAYKDIELRRLLLDAHLVLADGMPLVWASRWLGNPLPERVTGSDLVPRLLAEAEQRGWRVYFLGGTEQSVAAAAEKVRAKHPNLQLVGAYSPPFRPVVEMIKHPEDILERLDQAQPHILLVAFGCPKQEKWINYLYYHYKKKQQETSPQSGRAAVIVSVGVGATIDFLAGQVSRAPVWMQRSGLEWVYRLCQEPRRLFRRYATDLWVFGFAIARQVWLLRRGKREQAPAHFVRTLPQTDPQFKGIREVELGTRLDAATVNARRPVWDQALAERMHICLHCGQLEFMDSTGIGLLVRMHKELRVAGLELVLVAPTPAMKRTLEQVHLLEFVPAVDTLDQARQLIAERERERRQPVSPGSVTFATEVPLTWQGEIIAANVPEVWSATAEHMRLHSRGNTRFILNLQGVRFIDSTGVSLMRRVKHLGEDDLGGKVVFDQPSEGVLRVVRLLHMEAVFFQDSK